MQAAEAAKMGLSHVSYAGRMHRSVHSDRSPKEAARRTDKALREELICLLPPSYPLLALEPLAFYGTSITAPGYLYR